MVDVHLSSTWTSENPTGVTELDKTIILPKPNINIVDRVLITTKHLRVPFKTSKETSWASLWGPKILCGIQAMVGLFYNKTKALFACFSHVEIYTDGAKAII